MSCRMGVARLAAKPLLNSHVPALAPMCPGQLAYMNIPSPSPCFTKRAFSHNNYYMKRALDNTSGST